MTRINFRHVAAAAVTVFLAAQPFAEAGAASYPRTIGSGESAMIDYGPGPHGNVVGGGAVVTRGTGENASVTYLNPSFVQAPRVDKVPVTVGSADGSQTVWVPAGTSRRTVALLGQDGRLPELMMPRG